MVKIHQTYKISALHYKHFFILSFWKKNTKIHVRREVLTCAQGSQK